MTVAQINSPISLQQNHLLSGLSVADLERLTEYLELVKMPIGKMLYEPNEQQKYAYFPTTCIISLHYVMESGASAEAAGVGNEGMLGVCLFMGSNATPSSAVVQTSGEAFRLERSILVKEFKQLASFQKLLLRYTQALMTQIAQTAVCNRHHSIEQQLCRWLLLTLDRVSTNDLMMTQELVASMLGVRREGITAAAGNLQRAGFIYYRRGHISVTNRAGLEAHVCECYAIVKKETNRLLAIVKN